MDVPFDLLLLHIVAPFALERADPKESLRSILRYWFGAGEYYYTLRLLFCFSSYVWEGCDCYI